MSLKKVALKILKVFMLPTLMLFMIIGWILYTLGKEN